MLAMSLEELPVDPVADCLTERAELLRDVEVEDSISRNDRCGSALGVVGVTGAAVEGAGTLGFGSWPNSAILRDGGKEVTSALACLSSRRADASG